MMKRIFFIIIVSVLMLSFGVSAFANEASEAEVSIVEESVTEESTQTNDGKFDMTVQSITIMAFGMVGIFVVTAIIVCFMYLLCLLKDKKQD